MLLLLTGEGPSWQDQKFRLNALIAGTRFDFFTWEVRALAQKAAYGLLSPQRFMADAAQAQFVLDYLQTVGKARSLTADIERAYTDPKIADPATATAEQQTTLAASRQRIAEIGPLAEAILGEQVGQALHTGGFGFFGQLTPPINGVFTPLPYYLTISPRAESASSYQNQLAAGLTAAQQDAIEQRIMEAEPELSAYVTAIGGLSAYPSMLLESDAIAWVADVLAHEWTHHYLMGAPLGWEYSTSSETRTINETTASLIGDWAGQETVRRFYAPLLGGVKPLPQPLAQAQKPAATAPAFDFNAEMRRTRINVDVMLAAGDVERAELYMEVQRRYFVAQGYSIRRLNQAYFAFHGAYASGGGGAAGADPLGPAVRALWAVSPTPRSFIRTISRLTTLSALQAQLRQ